VRQALKAPPVEGEEMTDTKTGLARLGLDSAIRLRWALRDIRGDRLKFSPVNADDMRALIDMGYVTMHDDVPVVTPAGVEQTEIGD
jgi:hypothetical protein